MSFRFRLAGAIFGCMPLVPTGVFIHFRVLLQSITFEAGAYSLLRHFFSRTDGNQRFLSVA
jgi:hypothetical protein